MPGGLADFIRALSENGRVHVVGDRPSDADDRATVDAVTTCDEVARLDAPGEAPPLDQRATQWAFTVLYDACRLLVFRELGTDEIERALGRECPSPASASTTWSVDLALRHLPALLRLSAGRAAGDPLVGALRSLGGRWPVSSVGIDGLDGIDASPARAHPTLLGLYVDRIIATGDRSRCTDPAIAEAVRVAVGAHHELAPGLLEIS